MTVFVTGGTGYIGTEVVRALLAAGHDVQGLARSPDAAAKLLAAGAEVVWGTLEELVILSRGARAADAVIHLGATGDEDQAEVDAAAVSAMLNAVEGTGKPFIYTSGIWVLGNTGETVADEDAPLNPAEIVRWRAEVEATLRGAADWAIRSVVVRPAVVYGRGGGTPGWFVASARKKGAVRYVGDGSQRWPFVHVDDLADLYVLALDAPAATVLNAAAGPSIPVCEVAEAAAEANGAVAEPWPLEEAREVLGVYADALILDQQVSAEAAVDLGWKPSRPSVLHDLRAGSYVSR
ncbi:MAG TPA: NAD-dependent epimerase/dehydratase family protein [Longimicrobium sp.]|nr:NAD-dependent epimerase/dehydratase family protein [Longimicrobium sp.]